MKALIYLHSFPRNVNWSHSACQISIFSCSFSWLTSSSKVLFFSFCRLLVYDQNQWGLKPSTAIYKMQLLYTTHSKLLWCVCWDIIYATYLQRGIDLFLWMFYKRVSWVQVQENMWLLGLIYNLINNDQSLELDFLVYFNCDLTLEFYLFSLLPSLQRHSYCYILTC